MTLADELYEKLEEYNMNDEALAAALTEALNAAVAKRKDEEAKRIAATNKEKNAATAEEYANSLVCIFIEFLASRQTDYDYTKIIEELNDEDVVKDVAQVLTLIAETVERGAYDAYKKYMNTVDDVMDSLFHNKNKTESDEILRPFSADTITFKATNLNDKLFEKLCNKPKKEENNADQKIKEFLRLFDLD